MKRKLVWSLAAFVVLVFTLGGVMLWTASGQLLFPVWRGISKDLRLCPAEAERYWGKNCGNLRQSGDLHFEEVTIDVFGRQPLPGWLVRSQDNAFGPARGAILLVHGGGSDRREMTRFIRFYLRQKLDVLTFDFSCHGEAPCPNPGLTYGERESDDVLAAHAFLRKKYDKIYAMGSSVGAAAVLIAMHAMKGIAAVIAENPPYNFARLIRETPAAPKGIPEWFTARLIGLTLWRGKFSGLPSAAEVLAQTTAAPVLLIHSKADQVVPWQHSVDLAALYRGEKSVWLPEYGGHGAIWDANPQEYEQRISDFLSR